MILYDDVFSNHFHYRIRYHYHEDGQKEVSLLVLRKDLRMDL